MAHKTTIKMIEKIFKDMPNGKYFEWKVNPQKTGGFWSIQIDCRKRPHTIKEIKNCAWFIGHMFGENLHFKEENDFLTIN